MEKTIGFLTVEKYDLRKPNSVGSSRIRGKWVVKYWPEAEIYKFGKAYEAIIFQKVYWPQFLREYQGIKILDLCDPDHFGGREIKGTIDLCDAVVTSTPVLQKHIAQFTDKPVVCIPDRVDFSEHQNIKKEHRRTVQEAVWFGYSHNFGTVKTSMQYLRARGIKFKVIADRDLRNADKNVVPKTWDTKEIHAELIKSDIAVFPQYEEGKYQFKSNNKTLTCWALRLPVVATPADFEALKSREARIEEAEEKYQYVKEFYDVKRSVEDYKKLIQEIKNARNKT